MPTRPTGVGDAPPVAATILDVDVMERPSPDLKTTLTADPGSGGGSLATAAGFSDASGFKVRVENEVMLVTAGGTGTTPTVTRGQDGTTAVAHAIGTVVARVVGVQRVEPVDASRIVTYRGRANTLRAPGRAGTTGQKILSLHNATGSAVKVKVTKVWVDLAHTAAAGIAPTIVPPVVRLWKVTVLPTNGTALTKVPLDSALASNASVTVLGDASADGTSSATTLTATLPGGTIITQEFAPRILVVGTSASTFVELFDHASFLDGDDESVILNALEGIVVFVDYTVATANPTSDMWVAGVEWEEYTAA